MQGFFSTTSWRTHIVITIGIIFLSACAKMSPLSDQTVKETSAEQRIIVHSAQPQDAGWKLIWQDEFDQQSLDKNKWSSAVDCWGGGNDELQCYTDRPDNAHIKDGMLHMVAKEETFSGPRFSDVHPDYNRQDKSKSSPFTSSRLHTKNKFSLRYGRIDIRAKIAGGKGMWSALWMLPNDNVYGKWPASGEIDIMEALNPGVAANEVHGTLHYGLPWPQWENKVDEFPMKQSPSDNFHVYSIEWEADQIRWYVDGKHYQTQSSEGWYNYIWLGQEQGYQVANPRAPFDQEFFLIMNIAVGGNWPGDPDYNWDKDREMLVDYVRVYQCSNGDPSADEYTGEGCASVDPTVTLNTDTGAPGVNEFSLYTNGPQTLAFDVDDGVISNQLEVGQWTAPSASVAQQQIDLGGDIGTAWDIQFAGHSSVFLSSKSDLSLPGYEHGLELGGGAGWKLNGEVEFDMLVKNASADSQFTIKLVSDKGNSGSVAISLPAAGEWKHVAVKIKDIVDSLRLENGGVDLTNVVMPFVLEYNGSKAHVQIDNISLQCAYNTEPETWQLDQTCGLYPRETPPIPVFAQINDIDWRVWDCCGGADFIQVEDQQSSAQVIEFTFEDKPTAPGFQAPRPLDMRVYAGGTLEFDFKQVSPPPEHSVWFLKLEAEITAAQVLLTDGGPTPSKEWQHYVFPLSGDMDNADMRNIMRILLFPDWGKADGAAMQIKNVKFVAP